MDTAIGERWIAAADVSDLRDGRKVVRVEDRQIALFQTATASTPSITAARTWATRWRRAPSAARPSPAIGTTRSSTFRTAPAPSARRPLRAYDVRLEGSRVLVNLVDSRWKKQWQSISPACARGCKPERGRMARDAARLMSLGVRPAEVMREGALRDAEREEYGWGRALAVITDCAIVSASSTTMTARDPGAEFADGRL